MYSEFFSKVYIAFLCNDLFDYSKLSNIFRLTAIPLPENNRTHAKDHTVVRYKVFR